MNKIFFALLCPFFACALNISPMKVAELQEIHGEDMWHQSLVELSYQTQFLSVGKLGGCTAVWIGDSSDDQWSYFLTAAHCSAKNKQEKNVFYGKFKDYQGNIVAQGKGIFYVHPYYLSQPKGFGGAATDIAIAKLPKIDFIFDEKNQPIDKPKLYKGRDELDKKTYFVGYGNWHSGSLDKGISYLCFDNNCRLYGESFLSQVFEKKHALHTRLSKNKDTQSWAQSYFGDSGSPWWQRINNDYVIIGISNTIGNFGSNAARVSAYILWIEGIYSDIETMNQTFQNDLQPSLLIVKNKEIRDLSANPSDLSSYFDAYQHVRIQVSNGHWARTFELPVLVQEGQRFSLIRRSLYNVKIWLDKANGIYAGTTKNQTSAFVFQQGNWQQESLILASNEPR